VKELADYGVTPVSILPAIDPAGGRPGDGWVTTLRIPLKNRYFHSVCRNSGKVIFFGKSHVRMFFPALHRGKKGNTSLSG